MKHLHSTFFSASWIQSTISYYCNNTFQYYFTIYAYSPKLLKLTILFKFSNQNFKYISQFSMCGTCSDHVICLDLIPLLIFGE
jgi:hypothetical protein